MKYAPGEIIPAEGTIEINAGRRTVEMNVVNTGDRDIQVCSHFHFFEANTALDFDREAVFGMRLDIPAGSAVRFEPGEEKTVTLTTFAGDNRIYSFQGWTMGCADDPEVRKKAIARMREAVSAEKEGK